MPNSLRPRPALLASAAVLALAALLAPTKAVALAEVAIAPVAAPLSAVGSAPRAAEPLPPYRILPGVRLKAKPPAYRLPVTGYHLTGRFGAASSLWSSFHTGLDFAAVAGTAIRAVTDGEVVSVGYDGAYGNKTVVRLGDGTMLWYCHQSASTVSVGQHVAGGELIGYVGSTGNVTGPHLHLEVRPGDGDPVDPEGWLAANGVRP